jgi:hypothetical protein
MDQLFGINYALQEENTWTISFQDKEFDLHRTRPLRRPVLEPVERTLGGVVSKFYDLDDPTASILASSLRSEEVITVGVGVHEVGLEILIQALTSAPLGITDEEVSHTWSISFLHNMGRGWDAWDGCRFIEIISITFQSPIGALQQT